MHWMLPNILFFFFHLETNRVECKCEAKTLKNQVQVDRIETQKNTYKTKYFQETYSITYIHTSHIIHLKKKTKTFFVFNFSFFF